MTNEPKDTTLADYVRVIRQRRLFITIITLACAAIALGISSLQTPKYEATASVTVRNVNEDLSVLGSGSFSAETPLQLASAHRPLVTRPEVARRVKAELRSPLTIEELRSKVTVGIDPNSLLLKIKAQTRHGRDAAAIANAFARQDAALTTRETRAEFAEAATKLNRRLKSLRSAKDDTTRAIYVNQLSRLQSLSAVAEPVSVSDIADVPDSPASPKPVRNTLAALAFGLLLGIALAYARAAFDHRLRTAANVSEHLPYPVIGRVRPNALGHAGGRADENMHKRGALTDVDAESFRILRHNVRYLSIDEELNTILVTSAQAQEGKSTVSSCLAMAYAAAGKRTLLVECDLRRPVFAERYGLPEGPGLTDYLMGNASPQDVIQVVPSVPGANNGGAPEGNSIAPEPLVCITAGQSPPRPADLLGSERFRAFIAQVSEAYDTVIIDTAPLMTVADTLEIVPHVSAVLLCVRLHQSTRDQALAAREALERLPERPTGVVLTDVRETEEGYYSYYAPAEPRVRAT
ncbi:MAG TPA: polysaccharide biosynthesis tyrosine autokinase [Solirubrobacteraceae bacterium]